MAEIPIRLAHSPDSDDLVMWWPLVGLEGLQPAIDIHPFRFELVARDVEELNKLVVGEGTNADAHAQRAAARPYDVTAISCAAYPAIKDRYVITRCGGSFGEGYGPRVVARASGSSGFGFRPVNEVGGFKPAEGVARSLPNPIRTADDFRGARIAVPGINTSAFMTLTLLLGGTQARPAFEPIEMLFSEIPGAVARGQVDAGLLIHEAQLTFGELGLIEVANLGQWWATQTDLPLPLGLNVVRRDLDERFGAGTVARLGEVLFNSVRFAVDHPAECREHLQRHKGDRTDWDDPELVDRYLAMYVSALTIDMGERGVRAIRHLLTRGHDAGLCADPGPVELV